MITLAELYAEHEQSLHRYAYRLARDAYRADDLVQDTFVRAMGHLTLLGILEPHQQRAWLTRTLKNRFLDEQRAQQRQTRLWEQLTQQRALETQAGSHMPILDNPFDLVPERFRDVVEMRYVLGMTSQEIAKALDISAATVRSRLHLAMKEVRANHF